MSRLLQDEIDRLYSKIEKDILDIQKATNDYNSLTDIQKDVIKYISDGIFEYSILFLTRVQVNKIIDYKENIIDDIFSFYLRLDKIIDLPVDIDIFTEYFFNNKYFTRRSKAISARNLLAELSFNNLPPSNCWCCPFQQIGNDVFSARFYWFVLDMPKPSIEKAEIDTQLIEIFDLSRNRFCNITSHLLHKKVKDCKTVLIDKVLNNIVYKINGHYFDALLMLAIADAVDCRGIDIVCKSSNVILWGDLGEAVIKSTPLPKDAFIIELRGKDDRRC